MDSWCQYPRFSLCQRFTKAGDTASKTWRRPAMACVRSACRVNRPPYRREELIVIECAPRSVATRAHSCSPRRFVVCNNPHPLIRLRGAFSHVHRPILGGLTHSLRFASRRGVVPPAGSGPAVYPSDWNELATTGGHYGGQHSPSPHSAARAFDRSNWTLQSPHRSGRAPR